MLFKGECQKETLRGEGIGALDLQLKYQTLWGEKSYRQLGVQVKTGDSYAEWLKTKSEWSIRNIDIEHMLKWKATNQQVIFLWVNPKKNEPEVYWKFFCKNTALKPLHISKSHQLTPAAIYEIERLVYWASAKKGGIGFITVRDLKDTTDTRNWAKDRYFKHRGIFECPLGRVNISNYAWRHLTRDGRNKSHIQTSLLILPYVKQFLSAIPHQIQTLSQIEKDINGEIIVERKVLAVYRNVKFNDKGLCSVYVRLDETIVYSKNWLQEGMLRKSVEQSLRLESVYRKPKSVQVATPPSSHILSLRGG